MFAYSLDPLCCLVVDVDKPLLHIWLEEPGQIELNVTTAYQLSMDEHLAMLDCTYFGTNALCMDIRVFVLLYSAKMSWMGTSGVGPFIESSNSRFRDSSRSMMKLGTWTSTTNETISSCLPTRQANPAHTTRKHARVPEQRLREPLVE